MKKIMKNMKNFFLGLAILTASSSFRQDDVAAPGVRFGFKAGINLANITSKFEDPLFADFSTNSLLGITGGFLLLYRQEQALTTSLKVCTCVYFL
jgi:hypothetical protein